MATSLPTIAISQETSTRRLLPYPTFTPRPRVSKPTLVRRPVVYEIVCEVEGRRYIGATIRPVEDRFKEHCNSANAGSPYPLQDAIRRLGVGAFRISVIACARSEDDLSALEATIITNEGTLWPHGYNGGAYDLSGRYNISSFRQKRPLPISPGQCRSARSFLGISRKALGAAAGVTGMTIQSFERGGRMPHYNNLVRVRIAFEERGIQFLGLEDGKDGILTPFDMQMPSVKEGEDTA